MEEPWTNHEGTMEKVSICSLFIYVEISRVGLEKTEISMSENVGFSCLQEVKVNKEIGYQFCQSAEI